MNPADHSYLGLPGPALQAVLLAMSLGLFSFIMWKRIGLLRLGAPDPRLDRIGTRLRKLLVVGFGQSRQPRYLVAGTLHITIFAGFLILSVRSVTLIGEGFRAGFSDIGAGYATFKDVTALIVLVCCLVAILRRLAFRPARYHDRYARDSHGHEAYIILGLIALLMVADAVFEGSAMVAGAGEAQGDAHPFLPLASGAASLLDGLSSGTLETLHLAGFWVHNGVLLFFLCYLPLSKHFHVITALPNVFLANLTPAGKVKPPRFDQPDLDKLDVLGVKTLEDFTWKHILDFYSCTDCGRCSDHCPAYFTGTPLSPRMISIKCRDEAYASYPVFGSVRPVDQRQALVGKTISDEELWACTTCGACEEACPVLIEYVDKIVDMRRFLVDEGRVPASLQKPMADLEKRGNPYGKPARRRGDWIGEQSKSGEEVTGDGCGVRALAPGDEAEYLFFTDSCAAYDPRIQETARAFGRVLRGAGANVGTMANDEVDSGHEVRRLGEEGLYEQLRDTNITAMRQRSFDCVVTTDPHAFNELTQSYELGQPVQHHSQVMAQLIREGRLRLRTAADDRVYTFHDPCYLGRHNDEYDAPREVLEGLGLKVVEMERSKNRSFCCGGGSLYLFYEGESERRMGEVRVEMAEKVGAEVVVTACPFCLINLEDAIKTTGREGSMEVIDLAELAERSLIE
ncbi:MAG: electron transfer flavoprotein [Gemmatimonas sp. SG8_38_2]|nr:MAG: electron transfer flavoprotein [Gemmatimonas sp. SG8_38_2]